MTEERREYLRAQFKPAPLEKINRMRDMFRKRNAKNISTPVDNNGTQTVHYLFDDKAIGYETHTNILNVIQPRYEE